MAGDGADLWKAIKAQKRERKQAALDNPPRRRCYDWIIVSGNCHYAKNRSSFGKDYTRIKGTAMGKRYIGIGTVELNLLTTRGSKESQTRIVLNVLHIPDAKCNGINPLLLENGKRMESVTKDHSLTGFELDGKASWYSIPFCGHQKMALAGNPQGESLLRELEPSDDMIVRVDINLNPNEEKILEEQKAKMLVAEEEKKRGLDWIMVTGDHHNAKGIEAFDFCVSSETQRAVVSE